MSATERSRKHRLKKKAQLHTQPGKIRGVLKPVNLLRRLKYRDLTLGQKIKALSAKEKERADEIKRLKEQVECEKKRKRGAQAKASKHRQSLEMARKIKCAKQKEAEGIIEALMDKTKRERDKAMSQLEASDINVNGLSEEMEGLMSQIRSACLCSEEMKEKENEEDLVVPLKKRGKVLPPVRRLLQRLMCEHCKNAKVAESAAYVLLKRHIQVYREVPKYKDIVAKKNVELPNVTMLPPADSNRKSRIPMHSSVLKQCMVTLLS